MVLLKEKQEEYILNNDKLCRVFIGNNTTTNDRGWISGEILNESNGFYSVKVRKTIHDHVPVENVIKHSDIQPVNTDIKPLNASYVFLLDGVEYSLKSEINAHTGTTTYETDAPENIKPRVIEAASCIYKGWYDKDNINGTKEM